VKIDKEQIIKLLRERGDHEKANQAEQQLPGTVDHDEHKGLLDQLGIDPTELIGRL
jgi:hypothetical protein